MRSRRMPPLGFFTVPKAIIGPCVPAPHKAQTAHVHLDIVLLDCLEMVDNHCNQLHAPLADTGARVAVCARVPEWEHPLTGPPATLK